jgi:hypothetical protein
MGLPGCSAEKKKKSQANTILPFSLSRKFN